MSQAQEDYTKPEPDAGHPIDAVLAYALQPAILIMVMGIWLIDPASPGVLLITMFSVQLVLGVIEQFRPARPEWRQDLRERLRNITIYVVVLVGTAWIATWYDEVLAAPLAALRTSLAIDVWPHTWPLLLQAAMVFFLAELIWYWMHRAEHRWAFLWRASGHGAHHSFKHLGAINAGANHPLEMFLIFLPATLVELLFGVGVATIGAAIFTTTQASIAHANIRMNTRGIGWLITTNAYHIRHHSAVLEESNTNYGCAAIVWDRVFRTFGDSHVDETGVGPTEPSLWQKFIMPLKEPEDIQVAPD
jgi:sterol desaturase/sphingolipid hydroxylase (fatty acid hydroxylase superfamily)